MTALRTKSIRTDSAEQFKEQVSETDPTNLFIAIGKNTPWANGDSYPNTAVDSINNQNAVWKNMIGGKKITGNDIAIVTKRFNWTANTVYTQYDDRANNLLNDSTQFYVLTDEYNVYKCLFNNDGANSTIKPTYTTFNSTSTEEDGYIWKYMYTLNTNDRRRFLTDEWMPVKRLTNDDASPQWGVQEAAIDGSIEIILVEDGGTGYSNVSNALVSIYGDGTGATATAYLNTTSQIVDNVVVTSSGTGYTFANISIAGTSGTMANVRAIMSPINGHGSDPINELGASTILINARINASENGKVPVTNDFRQVSIIRDPYVFGTENAFSNVAFTQLTTLSTSGSGPEYINDEWVFQGTALTTATFAGRVFYWDTGNGKLQLTETFGTPTARNLNGANSGAARFVTQITNPNLKSRSGQVLYVDNIQPVSRSLDQTESLTIVIKF
jgi:hypothetical protein